MTKMRGNALGLLALTSFLFFASGSTGLAYEVIWSKRFTHIWGSTTLAMASVVASFLFGLGLGALVFGRFADRAKRPLFWYGVFEIVIGLIATVIPLEIVWLAQWANEIYATLPAVESVRFLFRCAMTLVVIGPPCVLMGGTLPLLISQFTPRDSDAGHVTGWLYAVNTFGAATGCAIAGFYLLPAIGLQLTNYGTAAFNVLIGLTSIAVSLALREKLSQVNLPGEVKPGEKGKKAASPSVAGGFAGGVASVYVAVAITGLAALVLQMVWVRQLALVLGGSTYAFTATLFIILVAIALGSLLYQLVLRRFAQSAMFTLCVIGLVSVSTVAGLLLLPWLSNFVGGYVSARFQWSVNAAVSILAGGIVQFLPGIAMGILFPLLVDLTHARATEVGRTVGNIYAWNTLGSIAGATFTSFYLIPLIGTIGTIALALALYLVAGGLMLWSLGPERRSKRLSTAYALAGAAIVAGVTLYARTADHRLTNYGAYMYGPAKDSDFTPMLFFREGPSCNVLVSEMTSPQGMKNRMIRVNGKVDASTGLDMENQLGTAYFPRFFIPRAKEVLVIGFGSGTTPGAAALFPDTHVTCLEIEPAVLEASPYFAEINHSPEKSKQVTLVLGDGRTFVQTSRQKYDLIISEPSNPWIAGVSNLFTQEYFLSVREHLNEGGVMVQWIQTYNFTLRDYALVARTLRSVFPHVGVVVLSNGADTVLMASMRPLLPSNEELDFIQQQVDAVPAIVKDLSKWFGSSNVRRLLMAHYVLDEQGLDVLIRRDNSEVLNTDLNMKLEFDAPLRLFSPKTPDVFPAVSEVSNPKWTEDLATQMGFSPTGIEHYMALAFVAERRRDTFRAIEQYRTVISIDPTYEPALRNLAALYTRERKVAEAIEALQKLIELKPQDAVLHSAIADLLAASKRHADAVAKYREALRMDPNLGNAANNLAWILATHPEQGLRDGREAVRLAKIACDGARNQDPGYLDTLAAAYAETGQFEEALAAVSAAQEQARDQEDSLLVSGLNERMLVYKQRKPYRQP